MYSLANENRFTGVKSRVECSGKASEQPHPLASTALTNKTKKLPRVRKVIQHLVVDCVILVDFNLHHGCLLYEGPGAHDFIALSVSHSRDATLENYNSVRKKTERIPEGSVVVDAKIVR